jgi:SSS family solute:Na+ symporter
LLPVGLVGLVVAGMFSHTMAMTSSDANAISAVVVRDIIPALRGSRQPLTSRSELAAGRLSTFLFIGLSMIIALSADSFGGVLGLIILWFGALVGPIAIPMLLGMLRPFRRCGPSAALFSWAAGLVVFAITKYALAAPIASLGTASAQTISVAAPLVASVIVYCLLGWVRPWHNEASDALVASLDHDLEPHARVSAPVEVPVS